MNIRAYLLYQYERELVFSKPVIEKQVKNTVVTKHDSVLQNSLPGEVVN